MSENVKKIRELADFNVNTEISRDDLLIVATGPDTRRDSEGNADPVSPQTVKVTIEAIITAYNKSLIPPSGGGSTTDPSDRPNAEVPKPGGGTYFQDTTPFSAANLDVMIKSGCGIEVVEECHNESEASVDCSSADLKYKTKKLCLSNIPSSALNITAGSIPMSALDTTSGTIPASAVATSPGTVDPAALSLDANDDFEIDGNGNLKLKDGVAQAPGGGGSSGGVSTPVNGNVVATGTAFGSVDTTFDITTKGGSASDVWGVFTVNCGGGETPHHAVWVFHDSSFTNGNHVTLNHSSKDQTNTFQFLAPVDSSGKCYIRNIETAIGQPMPWQTYYMGSIGAGGGGGTDGLTSDSGAVHIVKDVDDAYTDLNIRNTAEGGRGAIVKMGVNSPGSPQPDKVSEQVSVQVQGSNTSNGPRGALTYENFNASALGGGTGAVSNLFIDGGRISGYSNFDLISHVTTAGEMTLGKANQPWKEVFANAVTPIPSDERKKQDILDIDEAERAVAVKAKALLKKFRYKEAFKQKGEDARIHFGIIAQELIEAFESEGLDPMKYSMICYDEWWRNPEDFTDVKEEETEGYTHEDRYSIRYSELLAFIIAAI